MTAASPAAARSGSSRAEIPPRLVSRAVELPGAPDLLELVAAARDAGHEAALFERPMPDATSVAGIGAVVDIVATAAGAAIEDRRGRRLLEVAAGAGEELPGRRPAALIAEPGEPPSGRRPTAEIVEPGAADPVSARVAAAARAWTMLCGAPAEPEAAGARHLAIGGFAFRPDRDPGPPWQGFPAVLLRVPALALVRTRGRTEAIATTLLEDGEPPDSPAAESRLDGALALLDLSRPAHAAPRARRLAVTPALDPEVWRRAIVMAAARLRRGEASKVVLAREVVARGDGVVGAGAVLRALRTAHPSCFTYFLPGSDGTALVGATPELLVRRGGGHAAFLPMAGSSRRGADEAEDAALAGSLLHSAKDRREHAVVIAAITEALAPLCRRIDAPAAPEIARFTNIQHLASPISAELLDPPADVLELAAALHPTPAVGGHPRDPALALIDELEGLERGWYAGAVGWIDSRGDGELAVALRCGLLWEDGARLYAGVGVMPDSDPDAELAETELKLQALTGALRG